MGKVSAIGTFLDGSNCVQMLNAHFASVSNRHDAILSLDEVFPLHETTLLNGEPLDQSWETHKNYILGMERILGVCFKSLPRNSNFFINEEDATEIVSQLGQPPMLCRPIYLISVGDRNEERVVYVGKTTSRSGRFRNGHAAHTKLTDPQYDGMSKRLYLASIMLVANDSSQCPLEFVQTKELAHEILMSIEAQLIFQLQPKLNLQNITQFSGVWPITLIIQNWTEQTNFLNYAIYIRPDAKW